MFPVCTGINRIFFTLSPSLRDVPCMHRDKSVYTIALSRSIWCSLYSQGLINWRHKFFSDELKLVYICKQVLATVINQLNNLWEKTELPDIKFVLYCHYSITGRTNVIRQISYLVTYQFIAICLFTFIYIINRIYITILYKIYSY